MGLPQSQQIEATRAVEILLDNLLTRLSRFGTTINKEVAEIDSGGKIVASHEFLLFLIHFADRVASDKGVSLDMRRNLREGLLRGLLEKEFLPPKLSWKLIEDGLPDSFTSLGLSNSTAIETLLPIFDKEATEIDEYYATCVVPLGRFPSDDRGWFNRLSCRIGERFEKAGIKGWDILLETHLPVLATAIIYDKKLAGTDIKAFDILKHI